MKMSGAIQIHSGDAYSPTRYQEHPLGAIAMAENGDLFRYAYAGTATDFIAGKLYVASAVVANHQDVALSAAAAVGDTVIKPTLGATAMTADQYQEGFAIFNDNSPEGEFYQIKANTTSAAGSEAVNITIEPALKTAATTSSEVTLMTNPWNTPAISQLVTERACGVPVVNWDVSNYERFGWLKTRGMASVLVDTAGIVVGLKATISDQVNGAVGLYSDVDAEVVVGQMLATGTATEYNAIYLTID